MFKYLPRKMNGVFAVDKPSGLSSAQFIAKIQELFTDSDVFKKDMVDARNKRINDLKTSRWSEAKIAKKLKQLKIKIGHGGTLDPMASGVLVIGIGSGTKKLQDYLNKCTKVYETKALLGISTTTGDCEGEIITKNRVDHITPEMAKETPAKFIGDLKQTPPIFSALKVKGKPLYEYAREGIPLPVDAIKVREVKVNDIKLETSDLLTTDHPFKKLESQLDENGVPKEHGLANNPTLNDAPLYYSQQYMDSEAAAGREVTMPKPEPLVEDTLPEKLPMVHFTASVSSGTYIRSLISDFGKALDSSAYMVELIRCQQSAWKLGENTFSMDQFEGDERVWGPVLKKVLDNEPGTVNVPEELAKQQKVVDELPAASAEVKEDEKEDTIENHDTKPEDTAETAESTLPQKRSISEVEKE
ncbi:tRNA pseudouridine synthase 4 [Diutina catenulata]